VAEIQQWIMDRSDAFTVRDIHESLGGSLVTSMKAVRELIDQGNVIELGQGENEGRRGRSPVRYLRLLE
jgi:predicted transcriptional regulator